MPPPVVLACLFAAATAAPGASAAAEPAGAEVSFNRAVRPILSDHCFPCHGPDSAQRKADLRLDTEAGCLVDLGGHRAIVPGDTEASELVRRITAVDPDERMPPADFERPLSAEQIALLKNWIAQGAKWQGHW
ncbi:MAG: c-type cytochrome domain-containing protein, partial [Pirellulales bacterium]